MSAQHTLGRKVHYSKSANRSHCRYSSRPSQTRLTLLPLAQFVAAPAELQCRDCLRAARRDELLAIAKVTGSAA